MPPKSKNDPTDLILQFLLTKNRPYSITNICDELHGEFSKTVVTKAVDSLTNEGRITCKLFGKTTKLYFANQENLPVASADDLERMDAEIESMRTQESQLRERLEELRRHRNKLFATKPIPELEAYKQELEERLAAEEQHREELISLADGISPGDAELYQKNYRTRCEQWRQRRNKCREIIDTLCEATEKKPSQIIDELGLDTDEANGVKLEYRDKQYNVVELL